MIQRNTQLLVQSTLVTVNRMEVQVLSSRLLVVSPPHLIAIDSLTVNLSPAVLKEIVRKIFAPPNILSVISNKFDNLF